MNWSRKANLVPVVAALNMMAAAAGDNVVLENTHLNYTVSSDGKNLGFIDRASGIDYLRREVASACALVRQNGREYPATSAALANGRLVLRFGEAGVEAVLKVEPRTFNRP
jgi:hypothetical protein